MGKEDDLKSDEGAAADGVCPTGVEGFDEILLGGFPRGFLYLIQGDPGAGKTTLALQFLLEGVRRGEKALYVTLSETKRELLKVAQSHGWSLEGIALMDISAVESFLHPEAQTTVFHRSEVELNNLSQLVLEQGRSVRPARVVFDSLSEFRLIAENPLRYRRQLLNLKQEFAALHSTVLLLDDKMDASPLGSDPHVLSLTHGVLEMEQQATDYGASRRRLRVLKLRGVPFREGFHDYLIASGGLRVFPRLVAAEHHVDFRREAVASGVAELDALLGGGLDRGTTTLLVGQAGTGKSTLALQYACHLARNGEPGMLFCFEETRAVLVARANELGLDIATQIERGVLQAQQVDPAELSPGEFANRIVQGVRRGCKLVVIDSLGGYMNSMPGDKFLMNQLHELCSYLNQQGVLTILTLPQHGVIASSPSPVDVSYLADTVVTLRFFEAGGEVKKALAVVKKRSGHHEKTIREFKLVSGKGIRVGPPLKEFRGVLTGVPLFLGKMDRIIGDTDAG